jgi:hypothetical protein
MAVAEAQDFGLLFAGQLISQIGDALNKVALLVCLRFDRLGF